MILLLQLSIDILIQFLQLQYMDNDNFLECCWLWITDPRCGQMSEQLVSCRRTKVTLTPLLLSCTQQHINDWCCQAIQWWSCILNDEIFIIFCLLYPYWTYRDSHKLYFVLRLMRPLKPRTCTCKLQNYTMNISNIWDCDC